MRKSALAALLVIPPLIACSSPLEPAQLVGEYVLTGTPVVLDNSHAQFEIAVDTLRMYDDGTATRTLRETVTVPGEVHTGERVEPYVWETSNGRVEFTYVCPPNALCPPPPHLWGSSSGSFLNLQSLIDPRVTLRYQRIAGSGG